MTKQVATAFSGDGSLHAPATLQALLRHERSRSDRDGSEFSLAVFNVSAVVSDVPCMKQMVRGIRTNMRSIDEAGWLDREKIGVLLPATTMEGGRTFACRVMRVVASLRTPLPFDVYSYPRHWLTKFKEGKEKIARSGCADEIERTFCKGVPPWKRLMDIIGSLVGIILSAPFMILVTLFIRLVSPGKVFFRQKRVGFGGKLFTFLKFRTMREGNDPEIHRQYLKELIAGNKPMGKLDEGRDRRIIPGGRFIRKCSLDELPQFVNVLIGNMSLVGPRPCIPYEAAEFLRWHTHRFDILPGVTGLWQVSGKNKLTFQEMIRLDIAYAEKISFIGDVKILLKTIPTILQPIAVAAWERIRREKKEVVIMNKPDFLSEREKNERLAPGSAEGAVHDA